MKGGEGGGGGATGSDLACFTIGEYEQREAPQVVARHCDACGPITRPYAE